MQRRALLSATATAVAALGTAGCLSNGPASTTDRDRTTTRTDGTTTETTEPSGVDETTVDGDPVVGIGDTVDTANGCLELGGLSLQSSFVEHLWPTWDAEASPTDLFAVLDVSGFEDEGTLYDDPPVSATADGEPVDAAESTTAYVPGEESARLATPVPAGAAVESVAVVVDAADGTARYPLDDGLVERIRNPPALSASADLPERVEAGGDLVVEVTVENTGASAGTLGVTTTHDNIYDKYWTRRTTVRPGTTRTVTLSMFAAGEPGDELDVSLDWGLDSLEQSVTITGDTTTAGARRPRDDAASLGREPERRPAR